MQTAPSDPDATKTPDPLAKLHRMSTTAGVASQQYVAINNMAVVAALLGVASGLTIFSLLLLVIPAAGVVVAIVALRQISGSNGTETGKGVAWLGMVLSLAIGLGIAGMEVRDYATARSDGRQMDEIARTLATDIAAGNYDKAYAAFDGPFQARINRQLFEARFIGLQNQFGKLEEMQWNGVNPVYEKAEAGNVTFGVIYAAVKWKAGDGRYTFIYRQFDTGWKLDNIAEIFPLPKQQPQ